MLGVEALQEPVRRPLIFAGELYGFRAQLCTHDVEVANRTQCPPEFAEVGSQRLGERCVEERATRLEYRPNAPDRDPHLVQIFGIATGSGARIVFEQAPGAPVQSRPHVLVHQCVVGCVELGRKSPY